ncbi:DNA phosphorothioation-dependent restriction protein DptH [Paenibacillus athensensis]|nr:DNA phosphorothioation-dependent restriction protein DptH [Paenibacillus athensensis]
MLNMSNLFYNYLAQQVLNYLNVLEIKSGDKFQIQFEKEGQVLELYLALKDLSDHDLFQIPLQDAVYDTYKINVESTQLIVAATVDGTSPDFLTFLRNKVGSSDPEFTNTAILFIHHTTLDSIVKGTEGFQKEGMPFHFTSIIKDLEKRINDSGRTMAEKMILKTILEKKRKAAFDEQNSIFSYEDLLAAIQSSQFGPKEFRGFSLFYDPLVFNVSDQKGIKARIEENFEYYERVDAIHKYGNPEQELDKYFDQKGIESLSGANWPEVDFKDVKLSAENKKDVKNIAYLEASKKRTEEDVLYWERAEGDSKARSRIRNIIIFNEQKLSELELQLEFDSRLHNGEIRTEPRKSRSSATVSGKRIKVNLTQTQETSFFRVEYRGSTRFDFRIAVVTCSPKLLEEQKTNYSVNVSKQGDHKIVINTDAETLIFNPASEEVIQEMIQQQEDVIMYHSPTRLELKRHIDQADLQDEWIYFYLSDGIFKLPFAIRDVQEKPRTITGYSVWSLKRERQEHFIYKGDNKFIQGTSEYFAREDFRKNIEKEKQLILTGGIFYEERGGTLTRIDLDVDESVQEAYQSLIMFYDVNQLLPSLAYMDEKLQALVLLYIEAYTTAIAAIPNGQPLSPRQKNLMKVGTIEKREDELEIFFTPLHPLNIFYQYMLNQQIGTEMINEELLKKLSPINLLPYIYNESRRIYKPIEQNHSPEWMYYIDYKLPRYHGSRAFVSDLVTEKIQEFVDHFSYLFDLHPAAPIKINVINMGDCREVLQGIMEYYRVQLRKEIKKDKLLPIDLYVYNHQETINVFEEISFYDDPAEIKNTFGVNLSSDVYTETDLLDVFREKVHFYVKKVSEQEYEYCHIAFYHMDHFVTETYSKMNDLLSGLAIDGLVSGVPSVYVGNAYRTGFGTRYLSKSSSNALIDLAIKMNALARTARNLDVYNNDESIITAISDEDKDSLNRIYNASHWTTFIEPKVNLNFFKNDQALSDLLIIHYSDQYTSSSGYDAITVTRRSKQYQVVIEEFLREKGVTHVHQHSAKIINFFNAVNGDWLLRLISNKNQFPREKLSILSAIKWVLSYYYHKEIIWIPVSLEEILRVSGAIGLKKGEGLFSTKNLGAKGSFSDDLLLIGIEKRADSLFVHFFPIEVKIGNNDTGVIQKAVGQVKKTKDLLIEHLHKQTRGNEETVQNDYSRKIYRNFLIQSAIVSAEKMKLYDIWPEQRWDEIIDSDLRGKLLNDEYEISHALDQFIGNGAVLSFKKGIHFRNMQQLGDVQILEFTEQDGYNYITASIEELKNQLLRGQTDFSNETLLSRTYITTEPKEPLTHVQSEAGDLVQDLIGESKSVVLVLEDPIEEVTNQAGSSDTPMSLLLGTTRDLQQVVKWYPTSTDQTMHTNTGIIGTMGTGKTQFTKSLITQLQINSPSNVHSTPIGILIFDYKGDYIKEDFTSVTGAKVYDLYHLPFNPLALYCSVSPKPLLPLHTASGLKETISKAFNLGPKQENTLRELIMEAYDRKGISRSDAITWGKPAPTLHDVYEMHQSRENMAEDSLYAALKTLDEFEVFEPDATKTKSLFDIIDGMTVINLSGYDESIQNLVVAITLDVFYNQMQVVGHSRIEGDLRELTRMILVDEADNFLNKDFRSIKKILKEGREYGVGTILSTQLLSHFSTGDNEYANYILTWVVHNVSDINNKDVRYIFNTQSKTEEEHILNQIRKLEKHYSIVKMSGKAPVLIRDKAFFELAREIKERD